MAIQAHGFHFEQAYCVKQIGGTAHKTGYICLPIAENPAATAVQQLHLCIAWLTPVI